MGPGLPCSGLGAGPDPRWGPPSSQSQQGDAPGPEAEVSVAPVHPGIMSTFAVFLVEAAWLWPRSVIWSHPILLLLLFLIIILRPSDICSLSPPLPPRHQVGALLSPFALPSAG